MASETSRDQRSSRGNARYMRIQRAQGIYPDNMHPGLVPGISVEESRHNFGVDKVVFGVTAAAILAFVIWGLSLIHI